MMKPSWILGALLVAALLAGGCTATPINLPHNEMGSPANDGGFFSDTAMSKKDSGSVPQEGGAPVPDGTSVSDGLGDGISDGMDYGLNDGATDALGEAGALDGAGEAGTTTQDALPGG